MTKPLPTVIAFCLCFLSAAAGLAGTRDLVTPVASCAQVIEMAPKKIGESAAREKAFFQVAETYGVVSHDNALGDELWSDKRPAYFKLMQAYSENLVATPKQFCEALVNAVALN